MRNLLKTTFFLLTSLWFRASDAIDLGDINPLPLPQLKVQKEFEEKLNSKIILKSTKYYASGAQFKLNQVWSITDLELLFKEQNYRKRLQSQALQPLDYQYQEKNCFTNLDQLRENFPEDFNAIETRLQKSEKKVEDLQCLHFKNQILKNEFKLLLLDQTLISLFLKEEAKPWISTFIAELDPLLIAQYRNNEPLMQFDAPLSETPAHCLNAVMAIEDHDFLNHHGISYTGLFRAALKNITTLKKAQGGSTITQQLVKNYFLTSEKTYSRKAKEIYMALQLESKWSKNEILETYLNVIYMGQNGPFQVRGFSAASQYYFQKPLKKINLSECALLAAIVNNPRLNNPWKRPESALNRRQLVLSKMLEYKFINADEFKSAQNFSLPPENKIKAVDTAPYFFEGVRKQAEDLKIPIEGTSFFTSLNLKEQLAAQEALQKGLSELSQKNLKNKKPPVEKSLSMQGAIIAADRDTSLISVFVGGTAFRETQFNRALNSQRQIGSLIKPFVFLNALIESEKSGESLELTSPLIDEPFEWINSSTSKKNKTWKPENYNKKYMGEVPFYYALKESLNVPTAQLAQKYQLENMIRLASSFGFKNEIKNLPSSSLGASEHSPLEVLQAYLTLARLGEYQPVSFIKFAESDTQVKIYQFHPQSQKVASATLTGEIVSVLKESTQTGTAKALSQTPFFTAGKTGTTSDGKDMWFAGFTPRLVALTWVGYDNHQATRFSGSSAALPIWKNFIESVSVKHDSKLIYPWPEDLHKKTIHSDFDKKDIELYMRSRGLFDFL